jgi:hypothetical protein
MKTQRFVISLTVLNLFILMSTLFRASSSVTPDVPPVLRGRALELVDDHGRVRAEIKVIPALPAEKTPDGKTGYPESVQLRLISSKGGPNVKLAASEDGAGLDLVAESEYVQTGYVQILSRGTNLPFIKIATKNGREQVMKPE